MSEPVIGPKLMGIAKCQETLKEFGLPDRWLMLKYLLTECAMEVREALKEQKHES